ncbi:WecB/TagA/CpsF family glycosyltransferase [Entomospira culicis]|uniref:Uncharacterized protein n=1 Tax=Entomospira culicis TaxID=2719989 RepID=A0A968GEX7_9SPIO|nr:WecB/TagA/CpsF family glycosyltransferase [Entomospira culicis]NIZ18557.1 hypothetical protein [Entomospira culicis]NIZ68773.1 hypothetical protein [Entomospira culicis]WDI37369.1 WecB/TagA/CpsF family glycosyltransferase [Entomospira culicis]WDI38998.1 WecB/TagA/CpsF family glycosyltransferase [Entomospira culicis]
MEQRGRRRLRLLGVPVDTFDSVQELREYVVSLINNGESNQVIFLTHNMLFRARRKRETMQMLEQSALVLPAEPSIIKGLSFVYREALTSLVSIEVVLSILGALEGVRNTSVYVLGGKQKRTVRVYQNLRASYPHMLFVGYHPGGLKAEQEASVIEAIRKASPTLLLTSKGLPKQERWLYHYKNEFKPGITLYCRDCFDVFIGKKKRPMQKELHQRGGFKLSRLLVYPIYGIMLMSNRMKLKRMVVDE